MPIVFDAAPAATPDEPNTLADLAQFMPEPARHSVAAYAKYVDIECQALQVGALHRARQARVHQLALLGLAASAAGDGQGDPDCPCDGYEVVRILSEYRVKLLKVVRRAQAGLFDGPHEYFPGEEPPWL